MKKPMKKKIMDIILAFVLFYSFMMAFLYFSQRGMMYFPGGAREDISQLTQTLPEIIPVTTEDNIAFQAWHWPAKENLPTLVFFHGNGQAYPYWVDKVMIYHAQGYGVYFTDYRGYGGVAGQPTEQGVYKDARAHVKALFERGVPSQDMVYYGESLGTGVATQMANEFPPQGIIYESAYSATSEVAKSRFWMFPVDILMKDQFRSIDKISALTMPKIFVHGERDVVIPIRYGRALYDAAPQPKKWVKIDNGGHNDLYNRGAQLHILDFLSTLVKE